MFDVAADAYDRFMGRYSAPLAPLFADFAGIEIGQRALDVGCGPGALTTELVGRIGSDAVAAVDPSEPFVAAARARHPGVDVRLGAAESLTFADDEFDASLAQLVVHFMGDPVAGLHEMARVTRRGGTVAACVWNVSESASPLGLFWDAVRAQDAGAPGESHLAGTGPGELLRLFSDAGIGEPKETTLAVSVEHPSFDEWWAPFELGVGPAGAYVTKLDADRRVGLRRLARERFPMDGVLTARAWTVRGRP